MSDSIKEWAKLELKEIRCLPDLAELSVSELFLGLLARVIAIVESGEIGQLTMFVERFATLASTLETMGIPIFRCMVELHLSEQEINQHISQHPDMEAIAELLDHAYRGKSGEPH